MSKRLSKREALRICVQLWDWLAEDETRHKCAWPGWKKVGAMKLDCPLCEYSHQFSGTPICVNCPLRGYGAWPVAGCYLSPSAFFAWLDSRGVYRQKAARQIADAARRALADLPNKRKEGA